MRSIFLRFTLQRNALLVGCATALLAANLRPEPAAAASSRVTVPGGAFAGMHQTGPANPNLFLHFAIELQPRGDLDRLAASMSDPANPAHRQFLTQDAFVTKFGRLIDARALDELLKRSGVSDIATAGDGLVVGGLMRISLAQRLFNAHWLTWTDGTRTVIAPSGPLTIPVANVRTVSGAVLATTPRLADTRASFTYFRGDWYEPDRFRSMTGAVDGGGAGQRVVIVEDASDRFDTNDVRKFIEAEGAPPGATPSSVSERSFAFKSASSDCGRDDRGQEAALDTDASLTMAPLAQIVVDYDDVCSAGDDGTLALARALDLDPSVVVFPFTVGPADGPIADRYGPTPLPQLEAIVRGIPLIVPAGDDGPYGYRETGIERPRVAWPCVSEFVICAGGTQLGDRDGVADEGPWNDGVHATGGGVSNEPRPAWQDAPGDFLFSPAYVHTRIVPDVSAEAAGHLRVYWHGYGLGGVGGTSESAAIVGAELAAIDSLVPLPHRLHTASDLYALAHTAPGAFRDIARENDRGWKDNTLRPRRLPVPKNFKGVLPPPPRLMKGCVDQQPDGCTVTMGFDAVTGIGSIMERAAVDALR